jgi:ABC-2 type transport system ATP-binding protein
LARELTIKINGSSQVVIETPGELSGLLGWLAQAPLAEVHIEPLGLQSVYERYHG